eukprot:COSAG02_NODE_1749_length_11069_cov_88.967274_3_plen_73_part_00
MGDFQNLHVSFKRALALNVRNMQKQTNKPIILVDIPMKAKHARHNAMAAPTCPMARIQPNRDLLGSLPQITH